MLVNNSIIRPVSHFPYQGRTVICNDVLGIADVQEAMDSALHIIRTGQATASSGTRLTNVGNHANLYGTGLGNYSMSEMPVVGQSSGTKTCPLRWSSPAVFELIPQMNKYALVVTARLQGNGEFSFNQAQQYYPGWNGGNASYWDVTLAGYDASGVATSQLINRFYWDRNFYQSNVAGPIPATAQDYNNWGLLLPDQKFKQVTIIGTIDQSLFVNLATANVATLSFGLNYPIQPRQLPWSTTQKDDGTTIYIEPAPHPITGIEYLCDGVLEFEFYMYR